VLAGINICFDIVDDQLMTDSINEGAQIMFAQSNNADFGFSADDYTDEGVQQLAIARVRALELGRTVVNVSTVGTSAIIGPDGETINELPVYTAATMVNSVPLSDTVTPAVIFGRHIEWFVSWIGGAALLVSALALRRRRVPTLLA
jgi:apolipoprotein N-acyltransferase